MVHCSLRWSPNLELENKMEYYTEIWSMAIDKAAKVRQTNKETQLRNLKHFERLLTLLVTTM